MLPPTLEDRAFISYLDAGSYLGQPITAVFVAPVPGSPGFNVAGTLSNNTAPPTNNNLGVLPAIASAAPQAYTNGNQVLLSTDLAGNIRTSLITALPAGGNVIGHVITDSGSTTVVTGNVTVVQPTGTNLHAVIDSGTISATQGTSPWVVNLTQVGGSALTLGQKTMVNSVPVAIASDQTSFPVAQAGTWTVQPGNTANTTPWLMTINQGGNSATVTGANALKVDGSAVTQPISGTVSATQGTSPWVDNLTQVGGSAITLGQKVSASSLPVVIASDQSAVPVSQSGTWTVQPGNTANTTPWLTSISQGGNTATVTAASALKVDGSAVTQPISGTITANQGGAPWSQNLTQVGGSGISLGQTTMANSLPVTIASNQTAITVAQATAANLNATIIGVASDNTANSTAKVPTIPAVATTAAPSYTNNNMVPLSVDLAGNLRVTSSGTIGTVNQGNPGTIGNSWFVEVTDGTNVIGTAAHPIRIDPTGTTTQPVSGTITANAGTGNFNVVGTLTNNNAAPGANNLGVLPALANTAAPTYTDGDQVLLSTDTSGNLRSILASGSTTAVTQATAANLNATIVGVASDNTANSTAKVPSIPAVATTAAPSYTNNNMVPLSVDLAGNLRVTSSGTIGTVNQGNQGTIGNSWFVELTDGTNVIGTAAHPVRVDPTGTTTQPVSGTITANAGTGNFSVVGTLTNNNGAPGANNLGVLPAQATSAAPSYTNNDQVLLSTDLSGNLRVSITGTNTISGTVTANQGTSPWVNNITQIGGSAISLGQKTSANSFPVVIASDQSAVPVSGTVTANIGTTNGLALDATVSALQVAQGSTTSGQNGTLIQGAVTTAAPSYTTAKTSPLSLTTAGALRVDGSGATQPVSGTITANAGTGTFQTNMAQISGTAASVNNGTADAGTLRVTIASNSTGTITANAGTGNFNNAAIGATAATAPTSASENGFIAATTALPTAVTSGQLVGAMSDPFGREIVIPQAPRGLVTPATLTVTDASSHNLFAAGAAGVFRDISSLIITNSSATAVTVTLSDGTNSYLFDIAATGGMVSNWQVPLPATSAATAWTVQSNTGVSSLHFTSIAINNK